MSKDRALTQIRNAGNLPTLPEILVKLLDACDDEEVTLPEIAAIITKDPALSVKVLQLVNSAYNGFRHTFTTIDQAVIYLGASTTKNLAISTSIHQVFKEKKIRDSKLFNTGVFWHHSLLCATIAKRLASLSYNCNPDEAYLAGLLHDCGKILLASTFPDKYARVLRKAAPEAAPVQKEEELIGIDHCEAGAWLIRHWKLNPMIADAVAYHHEPATKVMGAFPLVKVVYLANILAKKSLDPLEMQATGIKLLALTPRDFKEVVDEAEQEVEVIAAEMQIRIVPPPTDTDRLEPEGTTIRDSGDAFFSGDREAEQSGMHLGSEIHDTIVSRVKNVALLSSLLEDLMQADDVDNILESFEKALTVLLNIDKILFFFPEDNNTLLRGRTSSANPMFETGKGLALPLQKSTSLIVKAYDTSQSARIFNDPGQMENIADRQILSLLSCDEAMVFPLRLKKKSLGTVVLGLTEERSPLPDDSTGLIKTVCQQVALSLQLEIVKAGRKAELHTARMAALEMSARKFAHEVNNPLGIINNYLMSLKMKLPGELNVAEELDVIEDEIQRISSMINQMVMYAQAPFKESEPVDINELLRGIVLIAKESLFARPGLSLSFIPGSNLPELNTSRDAVKQIIINLLKNASEAMTDGGRAIVRTQLLPDDTDSPKSVLITVADSGPGMSESVLQDLYKPFVSTKQNGHSGLGMSIVQKAVEDIGGKLSCSTGSGGTTFTIQLQDQGDEP